MALYFLRKDPGSGSAKTGLRPGYAWISHAGALLIAAAAVIQATGLDRLSVPAACELLPPKFLPHSPRVLLLAMDRDPEGFEPLDLAMALRGLAKLNPSRVIVNGMIRLKSDSLTMLEGVRDRLGHEGIGLIEGILPSPDTLWRPVPICTFTPPGSFHLANPLPSVAGGSAAEGKSCFLPSGGEKIPASLPLLAVTDSGEITGSIWWEAMKPRQPNGPTWLLGGKMLLFPNHAPLLIDSGGIRTQAVSTTTMVPMDLFLLRLEEKERGTISPDFESLWDHATVVIGSADDIHLTGSFHSVLRNMFFHRLPLLFQAVLALLLIIVLYTARSLSPAKQLGIGLAIIVVTVGGGGFALKHALLLPFLAPLVAASALLLSSLLAARR